MLNTINKILQLLSPEERRKSYLLLVMIVIMALLDMTGVASIIPFMSVLADPGIVQKNIYLSEINRILGNQSPENFLFYLGLAVFFTLVIAITFKAVTTYALLRFTHMRDYSLSKKLVSGYLHQPYEWFLNRHSADLGKSVLSEVGQVINSALIPMMQFMAHATVVAAIMILLVAIDPMLAIIVIFGLGTSYVLIYLLLRHYLAHIGEDRVRANGERFQIVQEAFGGIKDVKVSGLEELFLRRFDDPAKRFAQRQAAAQVSNQLPRYALELVAFGGMLLVVLYLMTGSGGLQHALPMIALYAFAGYRLLPALQQVYVQLSTLRFAAPALNALHSDLTQLDVQEKKIVSDVSAESIELIKQIRIDNITYAYPGAERNALNELALSIPACTTVAFVGATGSGKTTTVDLILGLLEPKSGSLLVDDVVVDSRNVRKWQQKIGYVPQQIYLADDTVLANIAFGVVSSQIDRDAVLWAAKAANLHEFVVNELADGYDTMVGERGVRLSGGQRQRIGIARALYHNPEVLVLDEATSALDNLTEQAVMDAVHNLGHRKTIIVIAHRLSTVRECDEIFLLDHGRLLAQGTYDELFEKNVRFKAMAGNL